MPKKWLMVVIVVVASLAGMRADGRPPSDSDWDFGYQIRNGTGGYVEWREGQESLMLVAQLGRDEKSGYVVAIPCEADLVTAEWGENIPVYHGGRLPESIVHEEIADVFDYACLTQIYPVIGAIFAPNLGRAAPLEVAGRSVKDGLWCKVVAAGSAGELRERVNEEGIKVTAAELERMGKYADGEHCFVLVGIASGRAYESDANLERDEVKFSDSPETCLRVSFPTTRVVMPAHTMMFPNLWSEDDVCVLGDVRLAEMRQGLKIRHYLGWERSRGGFSADMKRYTRVISSGEPEEIWFEGDGGSGVARMAWWAFFLGSWPVFWGVTVLWVALCSYVSGGMAGLLVRRRWRGYARLGLWNLLSIAGLMLAARRVRGLVDLSERWRWRFYVVGFSVVFLAMNGGADWGLGLVMGKYWPGGGMMWPWYGIGG